MKLYKCQMLDESMYDWEECIVAVMENYKEQNFYYFDEPNRSTARKKLLADSGYTDYDEYDIEFWFAYEIEGFNYATSIAKNITLSACDCGYANFKLIEPEGMSEVNTESEEKKMKIFEGAKAEIYPEPDCLMTMEEFLDYRDSGNLISSDGVGDVHDGNDFITDGFETDIFDFISEKLLEMTRDEIIKKFPYVAWFNK